MSILFFVYLLNLCFGTVIYVNVNSPAGSGGDGSTWNLAFNNLQSGLTAAGTSTNTQIWIAKGTYKPTVPYGGGYTGSEPNLVTFKLANNNALYGGFAGTETSVTQRNLALNPTILSGDIAGNDVPLNSTNKADNAWHVVTADGVSASINSLIITGGYAAGPDNGTVVPGVGTISVITSISYSHCLGAGLIAIHNANVVATDITFTDNSANPARATVNASGFPFSALAAGGGGIGVVSSTVTVSGSRFTNNVLTLLGTDGGAVNAVLDGSLIMSGCTVSGNKGNRNGGAIHGRDANIQCSSSVFTSNEVIGLDVGDESGGTIGAFLSNLTVTSCTFKYGKTTGVGSGAIFFHVPFDDGEVYNLVVSSTTFDSNTGTTLGGAVNIFGFIPNAGVTATISSCVFRNNTAILGGAIYIESIPTTIASSSFTSNIATGSGGAIFSSNFGNSVFNRTELATRSKLTISSSLFYQNSIVGGNTAVPTFVLDFLAQLFSVPFGQPLARVTNIAVGGGAITAELGAQVLISSSMFASNSAVPGRGGALLVGGSVGSSGGTPLGMNQAYLSIATSAASSNIDQTGSNNVAVLDPTGLGFVPNGVYFLTDGSVI